MEKAGITASTSDTVVIIKNENEPYRGVLSPSNSGTSELPITFRGVSASEKPEIWASEDISAGWSVYTGGNPNTYQYSTSTNPLILATGSSIANLTKRNVGASKNTLNPGEWKWASASSTIYYRLVDDESIDTLHVEAGVRNSSLGISGITKTNIVYKDLIVRYAKSYGAFIAAGQIIDRSEFYDSYSGISTSGNAAAVHRSVVAGNTDYGIFLNLPTNIRIHNTTIYNNDIAGIYTLLNADGASIKNNIIAENGQAFQFAIWNPISNFSASHNNWHESGDATWSTYKGTDNQELVDPLISNASNKDFRLQHFSPNIDTGTSISGLTTDILGNPIYGTPDIGPYEYQPPYSITARNIPIGAGFRVYKDSKYRMTSATTSTAVANMSITPEGGFPSEDYDEFLNVTINSWNTSGDYTKSWTESSSSAGATTHTVGDLAPNGFYEVKVDGVRSAQFRADTGGQGTFTYTGGYSTHTFTISPDLSVGNGPIVGADFAFPSPQLFANTTTTPSISTATTTSTTTPMIHTATSSPETPPMPLPAAAIREKIAVLQKELSILLGKLVTLLSEQLQSATKSIHSTT